MIGYDIFLIKLYYIRIYNVHITSRICVQNTIKIIRYVKLTLESSHKRRGFLGYFLCFYSNMLYGDFFCKHSFKYFYKINSINFYYGNFFYFQNNLWNCRKYENEIICEKTRKKFLQINLCKNFFQHKINHLVVP